MTSIDPSIDKFNNTVANLNAVSESIQAQGKERGHLYVTIEGDRLGTTSDKQKASSVNDIAKFVNQLTKEILDKDQLSVKNSEKVKQLLSSFQTIEKEYQYKHSSFLGILDRIFSPSNRAQYNHTMEEIKAFESIDKKIQDNLSRVEFNLSDEDYHRLKSLYGAKLDLYFGIWKTSSTKNEELDFKSWMEELQKKRFLDIPFKQDNTFKQDMKDLGLDPDATHVRLFWVNLHNLFTADNPPKKSDEDMLTAQVLSPKDYKELKIHYGKKLEGYFEIWKKSSKYAQKDSSFKNWMDTLRKGGYDESRKYKGDEIEEAKEALGLKEADVDQWLEWKYRQGLLFTTEK